LLSKSKRALVTLVLRPQIAHWGDAEMVRTRCLRHELATAVLANDHRPARHHRLDGETVLVHEHRTDEASAVPDLLEWIPAPDAHQALPVDVARRKRPLRLDHQDAPGADLAVTDGPHQEALLQTVIDHSPRRQVSRWKVATTHEGDEQGGPHRAPTMTGQGSERPVPSAVEPEVDLAAAGGHGEK
jgi:hypothetical protein